MSEQQPRADLPGGGETGRSQPPPAAASSTSATPSTAPRKKRHWLRWTVLVVLLLLVGGALVVYFNLNGIIERTVETQSTNSLNLKTELDSAALALFGGSLSLNDLQIASPPGFAAPNMLELGGVDVDVNYKQLRGDPVHISSIAIKKPKLVIEHVNGKVNFKAAMDQLPTPPQQPDRPPSEGK